jgi:hypothetical protein
MLQVSCCGLEELQQLHRKFAAVCDKYLGPGWKQLPQLQDLLLLPPGKRYSRQHMPQVSCAVLGGAADETPACGVP